jgi:hypothetical protein
LGEKHRVLFQGAKVWMSETPMELESQGYQAHLASGHVVVMGLGLGVLAFNLLQNRDVNRIEVYERDPAVIALLDAAVPWSKSEIALKLTIRLEDAFSYSSNGDQPDVLFVDIWDAIGKENAEKYTRRIQELVKAKKVAWWGQELAFSSWCRKNRIASPYNADHIRNYETFLGVALLGHCFLFSVGKTTNLEPIGSKPFSPTERREFRLLTGVLPFVFGHHDGRHNTRKVTLRVTQ